MVIILTVFYAHRVIREQSIKLACLLQLNAAITILFSKTPHKRIKIQSFSAFWFNAEYSQTWQSLLCHCRPQIPNSFSTWVRMLLVLRCPVQMKSPPIIFPRSRQGRGRGYKTCVLCCIHLHSDIRDFLSQYVRWATTFLSKQSCQLGWQLGWQGLFLGWQLPPHATPVGETRLLATVQMQLDELLTLALTFFF